MAHDARAIGNYFIEKFRENNLRLTTPILGKMVYFAHGWTLGHTELPLITQEVEMWPYGPMIRELYEAYREQGVIVNDLLVDKKGNVYTADLTEKEKEIVDSVYTEYSPLESYRLTNIVQSAFSPWTKNRYRLKKFDILQEADIMHYYQRLATSKSIEDDADYIPVPYTKELSLLIDAKKIIQELYCENEISYKPKFKFHVRLIEYLYRAKKEGKEIPEKIDKIMDRWFNHGDFDIDAQVVLNLHVNPDDYNVKSSSNMSAEELMAKIDERAKKAELPESYESIKEYLEQDIFDKYRNEEIFEDDEKA